MKLYATDQISISSVQAESLRPGQGFEVSDDFGNELLKKVPHAVSKSPPKAKNGNGARRVAPTSKSPRKAAAAGKLTRGKAKAEDPPKNKAEAAHQNKGVDGA